MNKYEAETEQLRALVDKGHPLLAIVHSLGKTRGVQWAIYAVVAGTIGGVALPHVLPSLSWF